MSDSTPPRKAELILESLGAESEFREAVLGDLAEEHELRSRFDGPVAARRWYYRESIRIAPYLLRNSFRAFQRRDVGRMLIAIAGASLAVVALELSVRSTIRLLVPLDELEMSVGLSALMLLWTFLDGTLGGCVAAWLGRKKSVPIALILGAIGCSSVLLNTVGTSIPLWFRVANASSLMLGVVIGAALHVWGRAWRAASPTTL